MRKDIILPGVLLIIGLGLGGCNGQQSDWQKARAANSTDSYEQFLKKYPAGEFSGQAQARLRELNEERDWQRARDLDTAEAYQAFLKQYPEGKWSEEARIRIENFTLAHPPGAGGAPRPGPPPPGAPPSGGRGAAKKAPAGTPAAAGKAATDSAAGGYAVQLGAFKSGAAAAHRRWTVLVRRYPKLLSGLTSTVAPTKSASGTLYRLQATGLRDARAQQICRSLRAKSQSCLVIRPTHR